MKNSALCLLLQSMVSHTPILISVAILETANLTMASRHVCTGRAERGRFPSPIPHRRAAGQTPLTAPPPWRERMLDRRSMSATRGTAQKQSSDIRSGFKPYPPARHPLRFDNGVAVLESYACDIYPFNDPHREGPRAHRGNQGLHGLWLRVPGAPVDGQIAGDWL